MATLPPAVRKARLEKAKDLAKSHGGMLLTTEYFGVDFKYSWRCSAGHEWEASYYSVVQRGQWCGRCSGHTPDKIECLSKAVNIARQHSGKCLSHEYINSKSHLMWLCKEEHSWSASLANVSRGKWCPYCAGNKVHAEIRIKEAKQYAKEQKGECLTKSYTGVSNIVVWLSHLK